MALNKRTYTDGITVITAGNLNDIQDAIIALEGQDIPAPYNSNPEAPGEASPGSSDEFARGDHVHPLPPVDSALSDSSTNPVQNKVVTAALDDKADIIVSSASGPIASFADGSTLPVKDLTVAIEPVQSGSGDPAPDNIRPISGWTGANVTRTGKNLLQNVNGNVVESNGVTFTKRDDGSVALSGTAAANAFYNVDFVAAAAVSDAPFDLTAFRGKEVVASLSENAIPNISLTMSYFKRDGTYATILSTENVNSGTVPADAWKDRTYIKVNAGTNTNGIILYPQLELGSIPTAYEPYQGDTYSIAFPSEAGTVYGGTLDVTTGKLTVDMVSATYTQVLPSATYVSEDLFYPRVTLPYNTSEYSDGFSNALVCRKTYNQFKQNAGFTLRTDYAALNPTGTGFATDQAAVSAGNDFITSIGGTLQLVYPLATPIVYDLTPTEVTTLLAQNNIWADTGDSTVQYRADTKLYIAAIEDENRQLRLAIAPIEDGATASQAYSQGKYFFRNGSFCKAKASIASGASFTLNTNYEVTTVAAELFTALNS